MSEEIIDRRAILRLLDVIGGDAEDYAELVEEFEEATPKTLAQMAAAAADGNLETLRISAHSLKSNGRDFGAVAFATACETLEHQCRTESVDDPVGQVTKITAEFDRALQALRDLNLDDE